MTNKANEAYIARTQELAALMERLQDKIAAHQAMQEKNRDNWALVSDIEGVNTSLEQLLLFGFSEHDWLKATQGA